MEPKAQLLKNESKIIEWEVKILRPFVGGCQPTFTIRGRVCGLLPFYSFHSMQATVHVYNMLPAHDVGSVICFDTISYK